MMRGDGIIGYWSVKTSHYSSCRRNDNDEGSEEEGIEVSSGEEVVDIGLLRPVTLNQ